MLPHWIVSRKTFSIRFVLQLLVLVLVLPKRLIPSLIEFELTFFLRNGSCQKFKRPSCGRPLPSMSTNSMPYPIGPPATRSTASLNSPKFQTFLQLSANLIDTLNTFFPSFFDSIETLFGPYEII